jgi:hypothetical protein
MRAMRWNRPWPTRWPPTVLPLALLVFAVGAATTPGGAAEFFLRSHGPRPYVFQLGVWLVGQELLIALHEAGHALAAWAVGFDVYAVDLGLVALRLFPARSLRLQHDGRLLLGGMTYLAPRRELGVGAEAAAVLGGPLLSLALGLGLGALAFRWPGGFRSAGAQVCALWAVVSLLLFAFSIVPRENLRLGAASDGYRLWKVLARKPGGAAPAWAQRLIVAGVLGVAPRESGVTEAEAEAGLACGRADGGLGLLVGAVRLLNGDTPTRARPLLEKALALSEDEPLAVDLDVLTQAAVYLSLVEPDLPRAAALLARLQARLGVPEYAQIAQAAQLWAQGRVAESRARRDAWLDWVARSDAPRMRLGGNGWILARLEGLYAGSLDARAPAENAAQSY